MMLCPFCNGIPEKFQESDGQGHGESYDKIGIRCTNCKAEVAASNYTNYRAEERRRETTARWNMRIK